MAHLYHLYIRKQILKIYIFIFKYNRQHSHAYVSIDVHPVEGSAPWSAMFALHLTPLVGSNYLVSH